MIFWERIHADFIFLIYFILYFIFIFNIHCIIYVYYFTEEVKEIFWKHWNHVEWLLLFLFKDHVFLALISLVFNKIYFFFHRAKLFLGGWGWEGDATAFLKVTTTLVPSTNQKNNQKTPRFPFPLRRLFEFILRQNLWFSSAAHSCKVDLQSLQMLSLPCYIEAFL